MAYVEYRTNNSGGSWWLKDNHWKALEKAGWIVEWKTLYPLYDKKGCHVCDEKGAPILLPPDSDRHPEKPPKYCMAGEDGRYMGALATTAYRAGLSLRAAADEWEEITGLSSTDAGCPCCGQPHTFTEYNDAGEYVASGPETSYSAGW